MPPRSSPRPHRFILSLAAGCIALSTALTTDGAAAADATGTLEWVVPSGPGSGMDTATRTIKQAMDEAQVLAQPAVVINKPGAGGAIGYQYLNQGASPNTRRIALASPGLVTNSIMGIGAVSHRDVRPVCGLFAENIVFMVRADSPITDGKALIERLKRSSSSVSFGIATALGGANHIAAASLLKAISVDPNNAHNIVYKAGSAALIGLLSGEVDVVPVATLVSLPQMTAGKVRVIAVSSPERLGGVFAAVPTWKELGADFSYTSWRLLVAPKNASDADVQAGAEACEKLVSLPRWKAAIDKNFWISGFMGPVATQKFIDQQAKLHQDLLSQLRLAK